MNLDNRPELDDDDDDPHPDEVVEFVPPHEPWRLTRAARETILFCVVVGLIAGMLVGIYRWTNASRFTPPLYSGGTTLNQ